MKRMIKIVSAFLLTCCFFSATAQYDDAVGIRFEDDWFLGSYKINMSNRMSVEGFGGFDAQGFVSLYKVGAEFQLNTEIPEVESLRWFYGAGAGLVFGGFSGVQAYGTSGLDYTFAEIPLNLSFELMPGMYFGDFGNDFEIDFALSARYILGQ